MIAIVGYTKISIKVNPRCFLFFIIVVFGFLHYPIRYDFRAGTEKVKIVFHSSYKALVVL